MSGIIGYSPTTFTGMSHNESLLSLALRDEIHIFFENLHLLINQLK
jgi:hypothetical protein